MFQISIKFHQKFCFYACDKLRLVLFGNIREICGNKRPSTYTLVSLNSQQSFLALNKSSLFPKFDQSFFLCLSSSLQIHLISYNFSNVAVKINSDTLSLIEFIKFNRKLKCKNNTALMCCCWCLSTAIYMRTILMIPP